MGGIISKQKLRDRIEKHLRDLTRKLISFDTVQETLNYLLESFYREYTCDLVAVLLQEKDRLVPVVWIGEGLHINETLNLSMHECGSDLFESALCMTNKRQKQCAFIEALKKEKISTWFTVPLKNQEKSLGLFVIGFRHEVQLLLEAQQDFTEFGHDVVAAIDLAQEKEEQKRKIKGIEWIRETTFSDISIESIITKVVERAAKGTNAKGACIYIYDEVNQCFTLTPPVYGEVSLKEKIYINSVQEVDYYFPSVEKAGGSELTIPLVVNLKTIGMLYVCQEQHRPFYSEDLEFLKFVSAFVSMQLENTRLYQEEYESKRRLEKILSYHQSLMKKTVEGDDLKAITSTVGSMLEISVLLFDRFLRLVTSHFQKEKAHLSGLYEEKILSKKSEIIQMHTKKLWVEEEVSFSVWPIVVGRDVLGYFVICLEKKEMDQVLFLTLDYTINVYAIEFIKQKLVVDAREQEKEKFINQLFSEKVEDQEKVITYAALINWNVLESHRVAVLSIDVSKLDEESIAMDGYKSWLWDQIKTELIRFHPSIIYTRKDDEYILMVKKAEEKKAPYDYWEHLFKKIKRIVEKANHEVKVFLGIGDFTESIKDYYYCYMKAFKAKNVVRNRMADEGYAYYDDLGPYIILHNSSDQLAAELFVKKHLAPLIQYSEKNNVDLFHTLYVFLQNNGNYREASKELFIHRSTLEYRIERVEEILNVDLNHADMRFELMMAYKLYNLFDFDRSELAKR
ncbi:helix-turn-helix domain-containing protein [Aeribacillus pallidus]|nr:helix-turn-helix domain-containing protein [Aeribacillus pallidus]